MSGAPPADRKRVLLIVLVVVAVVAIPGRLAWSMRSSTLSKAADTREQVARLEELVAQARRDEARSAELNDQLQALAAAMPADPDLPSVVEQLQALARESNVSFTASSQAQPTVRETRTTTASSTPATTAAASDDATAEESGNAATEAASPAVAAATSFTLEVDVVGTSSNLAAYLEKIRSLPRVLTVERLAWTWQDGTTGGPSTQAVNAHFTVKAYTWAGAPKSPAGATATGDTAPPTTKAP